MESQLLILVSKNSLRESLIDLVILRLGDGEEKEDGGLRVSSVNCYLKVSGLRLFPL